MPPVRWKKFFQVMAIVIQVAASTTDAQHMHQDPYSQTSDGWVPMVNHRRQQPGYEPAITQYANPSQNVDLVRAEVVHLETTTPHFQKSSMFYKVPVKGNVKATKTGTKTKQILKTRNGAYITSPGGFHGAHIPLTSSHQQVVNRQNPPQKKIYVAKKTVNVVQGKPKKPIRPQGPVVTAHSSKNEVFAAPPNGASYAIVKSIQPNVIHTRETQGLGVFGAPNQFPSSTNQQIGRLEFNNNNNRFTLPPQNGGFDQSANQNLFFGRPVQDDFSRNLVPPPISRIHHGSSQQNAIYAPAKPHDFPITASSANFDQFGSKFQGINQIQAPSFQNPVRVKTNEQAIDVQVTKEQVKQFDIQSPFNTQNSFNGGFIGFNSNSPRPITYEVTEGSRFFESPDFQYRPQPNQAYFKLGNVQNVQANLNPGVQNFNPARPGLVFQALPGSTARPPFSVSPLVDLGDPGFLPTPYKVDTAVVPTSQSLTDVSTVFAQVTQRNKYRNNQQVQKNPTLFEVKDISTHFPVFGNVQDIGGEEDTEMPTQPSYIDNSELTNEITTHQEIEKETERPSIPTRATPSRDPTRTRLSHRRRKPSTTTTTGPPVVVTYEPIRSQESDSGSIPSSEIEEPQRETERPPRRRRPRPNQTRYKSSKEEESENVPPPRRPVSEENIQRRPTSEEHRLRGRHRFRPRGKYQTQSSEDANPTRPRVRPPRPELTSYEDATELSLENNSVDNQSGSYSEERVTENQELEKSEGSREKTTAKPYIEEVHQSQNVQDKLTEQETRSTTTTTTEENVLREVSTVFHLPENEVDYTTPSTIAHEEPTTQSTTTTTTTAPETTTTKFVRARTRANKFDSSNRPKFSVKDYRQKLDHLTSTTQSTTTESHRTTLSSNLRMRFPQRTRTKINSLPTTTQKSEEDSATDQTTTIRSSRFKPKDPRFHQTTTECETTTTEKNIKPVNTRMRPFGKPKLNLEITTTAAPKVSIKSNLFSARRRAQYPSLRTRIQNKNKRNETDEPTTESFPGEGEILVSTETLDVTSTTDSSLHRDLTRAESSDITTDDSLKDDFSQRISDLTSSFKDNYDTPGLFKSVSPTSRRIPNYFTISTDDPILPIEAFFPNLKQESKEKTDKASDDT